MGNLGWPLSWKYGDRIFVTGPSGCGKTTVAKSILRQKTNVIIIDTKRDPEDEFDDVGEEVTWSQLRKVRAGRYVWGASEDFVVDAKVQDRFFRSALHSGPRAYYVDELNNAIPTAGLKLFCTQGRGLKASLIGCAQRPSGILLNVVTDSNIYVIFWLKLDDDQKRMNTAVGEKIPWDRLQKVEHSFMIYNNKGKSAGPFILRKGSNQIAPVE